MADRQIVLDTETTGIDPANGHRLIEIGCVDLIDRKLTGRTYHQYINPEREIEQEAINVHGISNDFLLDKPFFHQIADEFVAFIEGAELIIHNAPFDLGFINNECALDGHRFPPVNEYCSVIDTLVLARSKHPGQRNSLDVLCRRYGVDNSHRQLHGALLDAEILAEVYLLMTGGQRGLELSGDTEVDSGKLIETIRPICTDTVKIIMADTDAIGEHEQYLQFLDQQLATGAVWRKIS